MLCYLDVQPLTPAAASSSSTSCLHPPSILTLTSHMSPPSARYMTTSQERRRQPQRGGVRRCPAAGSRGASAGDHRRRDGAAEPGPRQCEPPGETRGHRSLFTALVPASGRVAAATCTADPSHHLCHISTVMARTAAGVVCACDHDCKLHVWSLCRCTSHGGCSR